MLIYNYIVISKSYNDMRNNG